MRAALLALPSNRVLECEKWLPRMTLDNSQSPQFDLDGRRESEGERKERKVDPFLPESRKRERWGESHRANMLFSGLKPLVIRAGLKPPLTVVKNLLLSISGLTPTSHEYEIQRTDTLPYGMD
jgi:hypothetical protein